MAAVALVPLLLPDLRLLTLQNQTRPPRPVMQQAGGPDSGPVPLSVGSPTHSSASVEDVIEAQSHHARIPYTQSTTFLVVRPVSVPAGLEGAVGVSGEVVCVVRRCSGHLGQWAGGAGAVDRRGGGGTTTTTTTEVLERARVAE